MTFEATPEQDEAARQALQILTDAGITPAVGVLDSEALQGAAWTLQRHIERIPTRPEREARAAIWARIANAMEDDQ